MNGKYLKLALEEVTLDSMTNGSMSELWQEFPDYVRGSNWVGEILDAAGQLVGYVDDESVDQDKFNDYVYELADGEIQDYYSNINKRVQDLSLWAYPELDESVAEINYDGTMGDGSLTGMNSLYLYSAMRDLYSAITRWAFSRASQLESDMELQDA